MSNKTVSLEFKRCPICGERSFSEYGCYMGCSRTEPRVPDIDWRSAFTTGPDVDLETELSEVGVLPKRTVEVN